MVSQGARGRVRVGPPLTSPDHSRPSQGTMTPGATRGHPRQPQGNPGHDARRPMPVALKAPTAPRYGSAAELAGYSGLSVKSVRRLVDAGKVRGLKVGRRLLIPFADMDRLILKGPADRAGTREANAMSAAPTITPPRRAFDEQGRVLPLSPEDFRRQAEEGIRALLAVRDMGDEAEQRATFDALMTALEEDRMSDRPRFRT